MSFRFTVYLILFFHQLLCFPSACPLIYKILSIFIVIIIIIVFPPLFVFITLIFRSWNADEFDIHISCTNFIQNKFKSFVQIFINILRSRTTTSFSQWINCQINGKYFVDYGGKNHFSNKSRAEQSRVGFYSKWKWQQIQTINVCWWSCTTMSCTFYPLAMANALQQF